MTRKSIFRNSLDDSHKDETLSDWHLICIRKNVSNFKTTGIFTRFCPFWKSYFLYFGTRVANRTSIKLHQPSQDLIAGSQHIRQFTTPNIHWLQQLCVTDVFICLQTVSVELAEVKLRQSLIKIQASSDRDQISFFVFVIVRINYWVLTILYTCCLGLQIPKCYLLHCTMKKIKSNKILNRYSLN